MSGKYQGKYISLLLLVSAVGSVKTSGDDVPSRSLLVLLYATYRYISYTVFLQHTPCGIRTPISILY